MVTTASLYNYKQTVIMMEAPLQCKQDTTRSLVTRRTNNTSVIIGDSTPSKTIRLQPIPPKKFYKPPFNATMVAKQL